MFCSTASVAAKVGDQNWLTHCVTSTGIEVPVASLHYPTLHLDDSIYETNSGLPFVRDREWIER